MATGMDTPRIKPLDPPYPDGIADTLRRLMGGVDTEPLALFRTIAHHPALLERFRGTGTYLLNFGTLAPRDRELVILRTCARAGAWYEWSVHVAIFAAAVGLDDAIVQATAVGDADDPAFAGQDRALMELCDALHDTALVSDEVWSGVAAERSEEQLIELLAVAGQYRTIAYYVNALGIEAEPWAPRPPTRSMP